MKTRPFFFGRLLLPLATLITFSCSAHAANQVWKAVPTDANWTTTTNWVGGAVPGGANAASGDNALFNTALSGTIGGASNPILIDNLRNLGSITFDTASAGAYVIGVNGGNGLVLNNNGNGINGRQILLNAGVVNAQTIAAPITFRAPSSTNGIFGFTNNATSSSATLSITGTVSNAANSRPAILLLDGTNTGNNIISGVITETGSTQATPVIVKKGTGTWIISGANAFTGTAMT